jgi:hypothetical protein
MKQADSQTNESTDQSHHWRCAARVVNGWSHLWGIVSHPFSILRKPDLLARPRSLHFSRWPVCDKVKSDVEVFWRRSHGHWLSPAHPFPKISSRSDLRVRVPGTIRWNEFTCSLRVSHPRKVVVSVPFASIVERQSGHFLV